MSVFVRVVCSLALLLPLSCHAFDHTHAVWNTLLEDNVVVHGPASVVKYKSIKNDIKQLNHYLAQLSQVKKAEFTGWNDHQQLAFLINAYNAFTVKIILDHYPVDSIKDIGNFFRSTWKITFFNLLGQESSLDYIEHELIRGADNFSEPRIHFALVCASVGCPMLQPKAYTEANLAVLLEEATTQFLSDSSRNRVDFINNKLQLSSIFKWYAEDFIKASGSVNRFVAQYLSTDKQQQKLISDGSMDTEFLNYDWSLNDAD
jgi:hypothetical protein